MKSTSTSSLHSRLDLRLATYAAAGVAVGTAAAAHHTQAAIVYSGPVAITEPATATGVYLDLVTGATATSLFTGYDFDAYGKTKISFYAIPGAGYEDGVVGTTANGATALTPLVSTVSSTSGFLSADVAATAFDKVGTEYVGIEFENDNTKAVNYGWLELTSTSATGTPATIVGYAYDNSGASIVVGATGLSAIPEPGTNAALGLGALALGAAGVRRWRQNRRVAA